MIVVFKMGAPLGLIAPRAASPGGPTAAVEIRRPIFDMLDNNYQL
jgi:hypothetical protein